MEQEEGEEEEEKETKPDPLHQLILHFSRTALTEKRWRNADMTCVNQANKALCYSYFTCFLPLSIPVNLIQTIFIWHMQTLWQR